MRRQTDAIANAIANRSEGNVEYLSLILVIAFTTLDLLYSVSLLGWSDPSSVIATQCLDT